MDDEKVKATIGKKEERGSLITKSHEKHNRESLDYSLPFLESAVDSQRFKITYPLCRVNRTRQAVLTGQ